jgi:hypothetical protein
MYYIFKNNIVFYNIYFRTIHNMYTYNIVTYTEHFRMKERESGPLYFVTYTEFVKCPEKRKQYRVDCCTKYIVLPKENRLNDIMKTNIYLLSSTFTFAL